MLPRWRPGHVVFALEGQQPATTRPGGIGHDYQGSLPIFTGLQK
jgi:hypothetical protein